MKTKIMIVIILITIVVGISFLFLTYKNNSTNINCVPFTGGSFNIYFKTNGGNDIPVMHVCIACSPDSYEEIPIPVKEGYIFDGWYYDEDFKERVEYTNSRDFTPVPNYDENGCITSYKNIVMYAKWKQ